jgi:hypothetical protein
MRVSQSPAADQLTTPPSRPPHAATIVPLHELDAAPAIPEGCTDSPFVAAAPPPPPPATSRLAKLEAAAADISSASTFSRWGQPGGQQPGAQGRGQGGRKRGRQERSALHARLLLHGLVLIGCQCRRRLCRLLVLPG